MSDEFVDIPITADIQVMKSVTTGFPFGATNQYVKVEVTEGVLPGETEDELNARTSQIVLGQLFATVDEFKAMLRG